CGASSDPWESTTAQRNNKRLSLEAYPNPSTEPFLYLKGNPEFEEGILKVYDYRGQNVLNLPLSPEASNIPWAENREGQTPGIRIESPVFDHAGLYTLVWQSRSGYGVSKWMISP
ncbi:MAG: hypothetical protein ACKOHH_10660, partial [Bacteroidota bacterium]